MPSLLKVKTRRCILYQGPVNAGLACLRQTQACEQSRELIVKRSFDSVIVNAFDQRRGFVISPQGIVIATGCLFQHSLADQSDYSWLLVAPHQAIQRVLQNQARLVKGPLAPIAKREVAPRTRDPRGFSKFLKNLYAATY